MSWTEYIDRLLAIQKENNHPPTWVIRRVNAAGHPPIQHWRRMMIEFNYSIDWPGRHWVREKQTEVPDLSAIDLNEISPIGDTEK
jgi:ribosomal protein L39E